MTDDLDDEEKRLNDELEEIRARIAAGDHNIDHSEAFMKLHLLKIWHDAKALFAAFLAERAEKKKDPAAGSNQ